MRLSTDWNQDASIVPSSVNDRLIPDHNSCTTVLQKQQQNYYYDTIVIVYYVITPIIILRYCVYTCEAFAHVLHVCLSLPQTMTLTGSLYLEWMHLYILLAGFEPHQIEAPRQANRGLIAPLCRCCTNYS